MFDLFRVGIGPSSSHSVGPMRAAKLFLLELATEVNLDDVKRIDVELYGSLALTGMGHGTDTAIFMGLSGESPETIDPETVPEKLASIRSAKRIAIDERREVAFVESEDLIFNRRTTLQGHPNAMRFRALGDAAKSNLLLESIYFSIGGGFVVKEGQENVTDDCPEIPNPFSSANELLELTRKRECRISDLIRENERVFRSDAEISEGVQHLWETMRECVRLGCQTRGVLPGGLGVLRRAPSLHDSLTCKNSIPTDPMMVLDWVDLFALAVNEQNAAGGRVVTAPTNGAAGIIPAVLHYYTRFCPGAREDQIERFFMTAAAIGSLYKRNASISGAEVGCQGEVGVACSMAAGAITEVLGGSPEQVEQAAEIGMEHNLGLTCDPIKGLVQIPCIERNAMGAVKAINASRLALRSDGTHTVSLDRVIRVMKRTGADMSSRYKETSQGGLAVNIAEC
ncbi:L-serine dehydratase 1 [Rhodopirellula sallentina SM41]|uniref:L-serine dehydratase n=1 Tax=Rhodopirellula sallentina SM41 TaxID=1263870 RepID=M5TVA1_9BACT|nr:L-serine dehydratase 1 [Rhodopirellula sallentina SM41]